MPKPNHFDYGFLIYKSQEVAKNEGEKLLILGIKNCLYLYKKPISKGSLL